MVRFCDNDRLYLIVTGIHTIGRLRQNDAVRSRTILVIIWCVMEPVRWGDATGSPIRIVSMDLEGVLKAHRSLRVAHRVIRDEAIVWDSVIGTIGETRNVTIGVYNLSIRLLERRTAISRTTQPRKKGATRRTRNPKTHQPNGSPRGPETRRERHTSSKDTRGTGAAR